MAYTTAQRKRLVLAGRALPSRGSGGGIRVGEQQPEPEQECFGV